ncbi:MAG: hypothetical protein EOP32_22375 [Rhodococcus sp. (in: high G+C Gram-positive bacteria)]|nr:MAG: hypothetical protein EOP32_22375 [Rhodococcus sp. (in: high G+C Gram-positive bacteria)]
MPPTAGAFLGASVRGSGRCWCWSTSSCSTRGRRKPPGTSPPAAPPSKHWWTSSRTSTGPIWIGCGTSAHCCSAG